MKQSHKLDFLPFFEWLPPLICHGTLWSIRHCFVQKINTSHPLTHLSLWEMNAYCVLLGGSVGNQLPVYSFKSGCFLCEGHYAFYDACYQKEIHSCHKTFT